MTHKCTLIFRHRVFPGSRPSAFTYDAYTCRCGRFFRYFPLMRQWLSFTHTGHSIR